VARVLATTDFTVKGLQEILVDYRTSLDGLSANVEQMENGWLTLIETIRPFINPNVFQTMSNTAESVFYRYLARRVLRVGKSPLLALRYFNKAIKADWKYLLTHEPKRTIAIGLGIILAIVLPKCLSHRLLSR
jgi:hypothetical protein